MHSSSPANTGGRLRRDRPSHVHSAQHSIHHISFRSKLTWYRCISRKSILFCICWVLGAPFIFFYALIHPHYSYSIHICTAFLFRLIFQRILQLLQMSPNVNRFTFSYWIPFSITSSFTCAPSVVAFLFITWSLVARRFFWPLTRNMTRE